VRSSPSSEFLSNKGARTRPVIPAPHFPDADQAVRGRAAARPADAVDILFVNPPAPDRGIWIRSQHRVGRRSREGMVWPQVSLAQLAALFPDLRVAVVDAIPSRMSWAEFECLLRARQPRYYVTQLTGPTLQNDMYGAFLAKSLGAVTIAFGTHVTPLPRATMGPYPALDFALRGEPELTLRELVDTLEAQARTAVSLTANRHPGDAPAGVAAGAPSGPQSMEDDPVRWWPRVEPAFRARLQRLFREAEPGWQPAWLDGAPAASLAQCRQDGGAPLPKQAPDRDVRGQALARIKGLVWRQGDELVVNADRPFICNLDDLPLPRHDLLPLSKYRAPMIRGPYSFVVTSRGCPAGCRFCIKHVSNGSAVRFRSPESVLEEIEQLVALGVYEIHMYADLFTVNREHVVGICEGLLQRGLKIRWMCNSRVDFVDEELLRLMARAGCWMIAWGLESGDEGMLKRMNKGISPEQAEQALRWSKAAGIMNWGYFIIGLPGETEASIRKTIDYAKRLPLDLVLFHIAAPHPGTPFFFEVVEQGWFRPGTRWEEVDMDRSTVLDYPGLSAEELERWARVAFREWSMRPGPLLTYLKVLLSSPSLWRTALEIGLEGLGWARG